MILNGKAIAPWSIYVSIFRLPYSLYDDCWGNPFTLTALIAQSIVYVFGCFSRQRGVKFVFSISDYSIQYGITEECLNLCLD